MDRSFRALAQLFRRSSSRPSPAQIMTLFVHRAGLCQSKAEVDRLARSVRAWATALTLLKSDRSAHRSRRSRTPR